MTTALLDDTVREGADSLRDIIDRRPPAEFTKAEVVQYVALVRGYARLLRAEWEALRVRLDEGVVDTGVRQTSTALDLALTSWLDAATKVREWAFAEMRQSGTTTRGVSDLATEMTWASAVQAATHHLLDLVNGPRPVLDVNRLAEAEAQHAHGKYRNVKDILATRRADRAS